MPNARSSTGLPPGVNVGQTGPRLLAALVEVGPVWLLTGLALLFGFVLDGRLLIGVLFVVLALAWAVFVWAQRAARAAGPGMRLDSLQLVGFSDGRPIGWGRVLIRWLVFAGLTVSVVGLVAMLVVMARHPRRQGWHDLAANAVVIKERPLAPPRPKAAVPGAAAAGKSRPAAAAAPRAEASAPGRPVPVSSATKRAAAGSPPPPAADQQSPPTPPAAEPASESQPATGSAPAEADGTEVAGAEVDGSANGVEHEWLLHLDDGRDVGVDGLVLLGRNPQPRVGEEDAALIKVSDETRTVSKSHLAVGVDANGLYVMDRGSTNGTIVTAPDGGQRPCPPGDLIDVSAGSVISFGDHWLEVQRPGDDRS